MNIWFTGFSTMYSPDGLELGYALCLDKLANTSEDSRTYAKMQHIIVGFFWL